MKFSIHKSNGIVDRFRNIQCRYFYFLRYTKQNIFLYTIISYTEFDLFSFSGLDGSRTRVQKPIPCPSTIIVCLFAAGLAPARSLLNPGADTLIHSVAS